MIGNRFITAKIYSIAISTAIVCMAAILTSCGGMSKQEKAMVGKYYIPAISDTRPLIELNADNRSVIRAIRPGEISFMWRAIPRFFITMPPQSPLRKGIPDLWAMWPPGWLIQY